MILQSLVRLYEDLSAKNLLGPVGWSIIDVSYVLYIDAEGELTQAVCVKNEVQRGEKTALVPQNMRLPAPVKRSVGIDANFLYDNSTYILGCDNKNKQKNALDRFEYSREFHISMLKGCSSPAALALTRFFERWQPKNAATHSALTEVGSDIFAGGNLVFRFDGSYLHEIPELREIWQAHYDDDTAAERGICLVNGKYGAVAKLHPSISGIRGAQSSGATLVSFNAPAFNSHGAEQGKNAPTGKYAAFAYGEALKYLYDDREHTNYIGDIAVMCYAEGGEDAYADVFTTMVSGSEKYSDADILAVLDKLCRGEAADFNETRLDPNRTFYVLGISPNAARLSVRFFLRSSFGEMLNNAREHQKRLEIKKPSFETREYLTLYKLLSETINPKSRDKAPSPELSGEVLRAVLQNTRYPATLINGVSLRIRAGDELNWRKAAIIKAYYTKNEHPDVPKEVLTVALNKESTNPAYTLGRLFSVLEDIQNSTNSNLDSTIKDRYFSSASATPATVFPTLVNLAQNHLSKIRKDNTGYAIVREKQLGELFDILGESYPQKLSLAEQGSFQLGYYHQTQERYRKKEDKENTK